MVLSRTVPTIYLGMITSYKLDRRPVRPQGWSACSGEEAVCADIDNNDDTSHSPVTVLTEIPG